MNAEPRERWRLVTKWARPRTRVYNFTPFDLRNKAKTLWEDTYRVGTPPMSMLETNWEESAKITMEDLLIIKEVNANKSPGIDGVPYSALKAIVRAGDETFLEMLNNTIHSGRPGNLNTGMLILLQKIPQPTSPADYRPIALLNTCYKLIDKIFNRRI